MYSSYIKRILLEEKLIRKYLPPFRLVDGKLKSFIGWHQTTIGNRRYKLILILPRGYPDNKPNLYVTYPRYLYKNYNFEPLDSFSHEFHTLEVDPGNYVEICHYSSHNWDASKTVIGVFAKGILWLDAYEAYLRNGKSINYNIEAWVNNGGKSKIIKLMNLT